jgi:uncharacterized membrane protein
MDSTFLILFGLAIVLGIPLLAILAITKVGGLKRRYDEEIPRLLARIYSLEERLGRIEKPGISVPRATESRETIKPVAAEPAVVDRPIPPEVAAVRIPSAPASVVSTPPRAASPVLPVPRDLRAVSESHESGGFEAVVAGRWLNYVGILALLFAVTFFLKYAFDNDWIGPRGRVGIGILLGTALYPWSQRLLKKGYEYFSEGIAGLGAATLYLSLWAGWHYYQIFSQSTAFALMIVVTAATFMVAVGRNSQRVAVLAQIGGLITPLLVSTGENHEFALFGYLAVLGAAVLGLAWVRTWKWLIPLQFVATVIFFWGWFSEFYSDEQLGITISFATLFFALFAALPVIRSWRDGEMSEIEIGIIFSNVGTLLIALHQMLWPKYRWSLTIAVIALAAAHVGAERLLPKTGKSGARTARILYGGLALILATLAIPIRCDGNWITIAWALEGVVLIWSGLRTKLPMMRWAGFVLFAVVAGRLAVIPIAANTFLWNARFATFLTAVACFFVACYFAHEASDEIDAQEKSGYLATAIAANVLLLVALSLEVWDVFGRMPSLGIDRGHAQELGLSALWLIFALVLLAVGMWKQRSVVRWQALTLLGVVIVKVFVFDLSFLEKFYRIISFALLGLALLLISFYYQRQLVGRSGAKKS